MADELDKYVCSLDKQRLKQAKRELNESERERLAAMKSFRDWILQQKDWLHCPTDARHLLMFLRNKKFVQLKAREKLIRYWTAHTNHPQWLKNIDPRDSKIEQVFKAGMFIPLPGYDSHGRKLAVARWGLFDVTDKQYTADDVMRAYTAMVEYMLMDEQVQVTGLVLLEDMTGFSLKQSAYIGPDNSRKMTAVTTNAFPMRLKGIHIYNNNAVVEVLYSAVKPFMPKKVVNRVVLYGNSLAKVYEHIDKHLLPAEYLPDEYSGPNAGTVADLIESAVTELQKPEVRDYLLQKSTSGYGVDESKKPPDSELLNESFRRLNVD